MEGQQPEAKEMTAQGKNGEGTGHKVSRYARGPQGWLQIWILIYQIGTHSRSTAASKPRSRL